MRSKLAAGEQGRADERRGPTDSFATLALLRHDSNFPQISVCINTSDLEEEVLAVAARLGETGPKVAEEIHYFFGREGEGLGLVSHVLNCADPV